MKTLCLLLIFSIQTTLSFAELHTPDTIFSTKDALLQQDINVRRTTTAAHQKQKYQEYQPQEALPMPEILPVQQALYPIMYYQPRYWQIAAWQQQQAAMRLAAYRPPTPMFFPKPQLTPQPRPTNTPQLTPTPIAQKKVIQEKVIIEKVITIYITPTPPDTTQVQEHLAELAAQTKQARQDAIRWMGISIVFGAVTGGMFVYLLKHPTKKEG